MPSPLKCVAISDTHGWHEQIVIPDGDVLIASGDFCKYGRKEEVKEFALWLQKLPHRFKLVTAGNHDKPVEKQTAKCRRLFQDAGVTLLLNEEIVLDGIKFWGSPVTPKFFEWHFMKARGPEIAKVWAQIPDDVDVLITHGPPYGHGDLAPAYRTAHPKAAGCLDLLNRIREIQKASSYYNPRFHVFGHIHDGYGMTQSDQFHGVTFVNASICTERYQPSNEPLVFEVSSRSSG